MIEFWESSFIEKQLMWGAEPADSAIQAKDFFIANNARDILLPGFGYGRNARIFLDNGIKVTGIEISKTAIDLAQAQGADNMTVYHGSVTDMPFDNKLYDGIFCFALIHLLNNRERKKFIRDCYDQLKPGGYMIFVTISKKAPMYGKGRKLSKERFEARKGVQLFFYDADSIQREFGKYGLVEFPEMEEPNNGASLSFIAIKCKKE
ncbi:class I SAM-dependent methyltransferase [Chitinophaga sp. RAB17]|uniref:class I SAM-dependent methyltransferase n=1 Tax=Chitinophaga sp. RAB17 TaxID=3233049 RepID=UPI003F91AD67